MRRRPRRISLHSYTVQIPFSLSLNQLLILLYTIFFRNQKSSKIWDSTVESARSKKRGLKRNTVPAFIHGSKDPCLLPAASTCSLLLLPFSKHFSYHYNDYAFQGKAITIVCSMGADYSLPQINRLESIPTMITDNQLSFRRSPDHFYMLITSQI